jgi:hypothetical protein
MSINRREKSFRSNSVASFQTTQDSKRDSARLPSDYSPPIQKVRGVNDREQLSNLIDYQLTVRPKVDLTRYQMSMLLELNCFLVTKIGIDLTGWITIEFLWNRLLGSNKVWEIRDQNERRVLTLANMILLSSQNSWMTLGERTEINKSLLTYLEETEILPRERTVQSRLDYWKNEKFLEVRAVRLDVFMERESQSIRYSSYCKGYGESSSMGRRQKTRPSPELDGDEERPEVILSLREIPNLLFLNLLELRKKEYGRKA